MTDDEKKTGLLKLREPVAAHYISKKPVPTRQQTEDLKANASLGIKCGVCGGWHHRNVQHLDYMGHAAVTDRLLEVDPLWDWDYIAKDQNGNPIYEQNGGLWITLTVCGVTRKAYGAAEGKKGPDAIKEIIGDAIRNGAMRFGVGLELWHKGVLHLELPEATEEPPATPSLPECTPEVFKENTPNWSKVILTGQKTPDQLIAFLSTRAVFTEEQKKTIRSWAAPAEQTTEE